MTETPSVPTLAVPDGRSKPEFHHIGIQTNDLDNSVRWYTDFHGAERVWTLDVFSELTRRRLPGIRELTEMAIGPVRVHLFERAGHTFDPAESAVGFQHFCFGVAAPEQLEVIRRRWIELYASGRYTFALDEQPTEIVTDDDGVQSFYVYDVNGLEFEFTYVPSDAS
ncbi:MAG TPA: VOC family protein [Streptosporangiaceae bacterium]|nr:VOC family protein [Streptosporangiaceae bacterium]